MRHDLWGGAGGLQTVSIWHLRQTADGTNFLKVTITSSMASPLNYIYRYAPMQLNVVSKQVRTSSSNAGKIFVFSIVSFSSKMGLIF